MAEVKEGESAVEGSSPDQSFLLLDGLLMENLKEIRDLLGEQGMVVDREIRVELTEDQAREVLNEGVKGAAALAASMPAPPSPKGKGKKKGKSPRKEEEPPKYEASVQEDEVKGLAETKPLLMVVRKENLVEELRGFVGPVDPVQHASAPDSLRAKYNMGRGYNLLHHAFMPDHAAIVIDLFEQYEVAWIAMHEDIGTKRKEKPVTVDMENIMEFLFPPGMLHPRSTGRLLVFGNYGPFDEEGKLTAGMRGGHVVTDRELKCMIDEIERDDILSVYVRDKGMSEAQRLEVLRDADVAGKALPNMTPKQVRTLFSKCTRDAEGLLNFHDMQRVILRARNERLKEMKRMFPNVTSAKEAAERIKPPPPAYGRGLVKSKVDKTIKALTGGKGLRTSQKPKTKRKLGAPARVQGIFDVTKKVGDSETFDIVAKGLSKASHAMCELSEKNNPGLTANVRIIRDVAKPAGIGDWDNTCCLKGASRGSYVPTHVKH